MKHAPKQRLADILLLWTVVSSSCENLGSFLRTFASSTQRRHFRYRCHHNMHRLSSSSARSAFLSNYKRKIACNWRSRGVGNTGPIGPEYPWDYPTISVSLGAGRERRVFSSSDNRPRQGQNEDQIYTQEEFKLMEMEATARRKRLGQMEQRFQKAVSREDRTLFLEAKLAKEQEADISSVGDFLTNDKQSDCMSDAERSELEGLLRARNNYEEQYDSQDFSEEHREFKALHNDVFARLIRWCEGNRKSLEKENSVASKIFYLDGPDGGTSSFLIHRGNFAPTQCYVANRHESTCLVLRQSGGGPLPEENVIDATASEALTKIISGVNQQGSFAKHEFTGYYFDGCNGYAPHIINMMSAALLVLESDENWRRSETNDHPIVVGYSLLGGTKNLVEKELQVSRALTLIARSRGMNVVHALDDPSTFGLPPNVPKLGGKWDNTFTTWLILHPE